MSLSSAGVPPAGFPYFTLRKTASETPALQEERQSVAAQDERPELLRRGINSMLFFFAHMFATRTNWRLETNRLTRALEEHRRSRRELCDLTASNPTTCRFAYPEQEILAALANPQGLIYRPESKGLRNAREAVAGYYRGRAGF